MQISATGLAAAPKSSAVSRSPSGPFSDRADVPEEGAASFPPLLLLSDRGNRAALMAQPRGPSQFWRVAGQELPNPATHVAPPSIMQIRISQLLERQSEALRERGDPADARHGTQRGDAPRTEEGGRPADTATPGEAAGSGADRSVPGDDAARGPQSEPPRRAAPILAILAAEGAPVVKPVPIEAVAAGIPDGPRIDKAA